MRQSEIVFFSSDSRPLYKSDIFNVACLPTNYVVHFRYKEKYIQRDIVKSSKKLKGRTGIIFFCSSKGSNGNTYDYISLRKVRIVDVIENSNTGLFHFFLELMEFGNWIIKENQSNLPPEMFVRELLLHKLEFSNWQDRIAGIRRYFNQHLFFQIELYDQNNKIIYPSYDEYVQSSYYNLMDEKEYFLSLSFIQTQIVSDYEEVPSVLKIEDKTDQLVINTNEYIDIGASSDNRKVRILTKSINNNNVDSYLVLSNTLMNLKNNQAVGVLQTISITCRIKKNNRRIVLFSFCSILAIISLAFLAKFNSSLSTVQPSYISLAVSLLFSAFSSGLFYRFFNKK